MFSPTDTFDHDFHAEKMGGNDACVQCHTDPGAVKNRSTVTPCLACHETMAVEGAFVGSTDSPVLDWAMGYKDALHGLCIKCHEQYAEKKGEGLARCGACHLEMEGQVVKPPKISNEDSNDG
jgi:hypothetical protein